MKREYVVVVGAQGAGKTVWSSQYVAPCVRLLLYDPTRGYAADYDWDEETGRDVITGRTGRFRFASDNPDDVPFLFDAAFAVGDCTLLIEECGTFFQRGKLDDWARRVVFMGRHRRVNVVFVAQRAASIPIDIRSQANRVVSFRQIEPDDCTAVAQILGRQYRDKLPGLPDLHCYDWKNGQTTTYALQLPNSVPNSELTSVTETDNDSEIQLDKED